MIPEPSVSPDGHLLAEPTAEGMAFRPVRRWVVRRVVALLALGALGLAAAFVVAALNWTIPGGPPVWFLATSAAIIGFAGLAAGAHSWMFRATPLVVLRTGRVSYGPRVLLEPGAARRLRIERIPDSEGELSFSVVADNRWGPVVRIETAYLQTFSTEAAANWFAAQLAGVIGAEVVSNESTTASLG